jgi:F0F1-type ATP synthase membrane subunit c/vacuolar-type H+-ATPase subunit K
MERIFKIVVASIILCVISLSIGKMGQKWVESISRNPEAADKMFVPSLIIVGAIDMISLVAIILLFFG